MPWLQRGGVLPAGGDPPWCLLHGSHLIPPGAQGHAAFPPSTRGRRRAYQEGRQLAVQLPTPPPRLPQPAPCSLAMSPGIPCAQRSPAWRRGQQEHGAQVPSLGAALGQGRPRLQPPSLGALGSAFPVSASQPAQLFPTVRPGAGRAHTDARAAAAASTPAINACIPGSRPGPGLPGCQGPHGPGPMICRGIRHRGPALMGQQPSLACREGLPHLEKPTLEHSIRGPLLYS